MVLFLATRRVTPEPNLSTDVADPGSQSPPVNDKGQAKFALEPAKFDIQQWAPSSTLPVSGLARTKPDLCK